MGVDVLNPQGTGRRSLLGHRLLLALLQKSRPMRELHAALGRAVAGTELRAALGELQATGLISCSIESSGPRGGRPREVWSLLYPGSSAIAAARQAVAASSDLRARARSRREAVPTDLGRGDLAAVGGTRRRTRRRKPVPRALAEEVCDWIASGQFLRDFCRLPGAPSTRTVYAWAAKDPAFRRRLQTARDHGEESIREGYLDLIDSPAAAAVAAGGAQTWQAFQRCWIRPIDLRLQRWRRHPRRHLPRGPA